MKILIIDDERLFADALAETLGRWGHEPAAAYSAFEGLEKARKGAFDLVLLDVQMPDRNGLDLLPDLTRQAPQSAVVVITGLGSARGAVDALQKGAVNYLEKPFELAELRSLIQGLHEKARLQGLQPEQLPESEGFMPLHSEAMREVYRRVATVAQQDITVLISGETGVGKQPLARMIHTQSGRAQGPWIELNCASLPPALAESILFGHEAGAYTDAKSQAPGIFESAKGGTVFLDEVGELSAEVQAKLLKVIEQGELMRLGSSKAVRLDVRIVAATNRDLEAEARAGRFRPDLLYRLNGYPIRVPALRERPGDIEDLASYFAAQASRRFKRPMPPFDAAEMKKLRAAAWPGNCRELKHLVERAVLEGIEPSSLLELAQAAPGRPQKLASLDEEGLRRLMDEFHWNRSEVSKFLGVSRPTLLKALKQYGLDQH